MVTEMDKKDAVIKALREYWQAFENAERVDLVPVVRCGECQYWDSFPSCSATPQYHACRRRIMGNVHTMREDFCSQGERKKDGGEHG